MPYIILSSTKGDEQITRSFSEYQTRDDLAQTLIDYFEDYLQVLQRGNEDPMLEYSSDDMFKFCDEFFGELVCLEKQDDHTDLWIPYSTEWVKESIYLYLRSKCRKNPEEKSVESSEADSMEVDERITILN